MMNRAIRNILLPIALAGALAISGCQPAWSFSLEGLDGGEFELDYPAWQAYQPFQVEESLPLEQILYGSGARIIDSITLADLAGKAYSFSWTETADALTLSRTGVLSGLDLEIHPLTITVARSRWESRVEGGIFDIAPTAAEALGIPAPALSTGRSLGTAPADAVLLLLLDGFGYLRYQEALEEGLIPELAALDPPLVGLTTYPPITTVSSASLLTGSEPASHGVALEGIRQTEAETLFDVARASGLEVVAVEGEALAFNLRGAALQLSGDRDGNGGTDDNVLSNSLAVLDAGMPDLLFIHFHGIDDLGHEVGPGDPAERAKIQEVDASVGQILDRLPSGTLVIIFADHGMHIVNQDSRLGSHGNLIARDMLIPIWMARIGD